jgi:phospho-N-acetylmuramoyl-pentapeptide-transferase
MALEVNAMLYWLAQSDYTSVFNLFRYISVRTGYAIATAIVLALFFRSLINRMREGAPSEAVSPIGAPESDTTALLSAVLVSTLLWANLLNSNIWIAIGTAIGFGLVGLHDERAIHQGRRPFSRRTPLLIETIIAIAAWTVTYLVRRELLATSPGFEERSTVFGFISLMFGTVLVVGVANAVKLIDSGDRFAIWAVAIAAAVVGMTSYLAGNVVLAEDFHLPYVAGTGELAVPCGAIAGACLGLAWFRAPSASIFMGETGCLALGATLGVVAMVVWAIPAPYSPAHSVGP